MKKHIFFILMLVAMTMASCNSDDGSSKDSWNKDIPVMDEIDMTTDESFANKGLNDFAYNFFVEAVKDENLVDEKGNKSFSPISAAIALAMAANTFDENVEHAILNMLGQSDLASLNATCNKLMRFLPSERNGGKFTLANSVWYNNSYQPDADWSKTLGAVYYSGVNALDFSDDRSVSIINSWCSDKTGGLIDKLTESIGSDEIVRILNAMYFCGKWKMPFDIENTRKMVFNGKTFASETEMMHNVGAYLYGKEELFEVLEVPFEGNTVLGLILPSESLDAEELAITLDYNSLYNQRNVSYSKVNLYLPKFSVKDEDAGEITPVLCSLGFPTNGIPQKMGISKDTNLRVIQKSNTSIDEKGAILASVTMIGSYGSNGGPSTDSLNEVTLTFDHPFIYLIKNKLTGTVLMAGVINNL